MKLPEDMSGSHTEITVDTKKFTIRKMKEGWQRWHNNHPGMPEEPNISYRRGFLDAVYLFTSLEPEDMEGGNE